MATDTTYRALTDAQIAQLKQQGCCCDDWSTVQVAAGFDPARVRAARFEGQVRLGVLAGTTTNAAGLQRPSGIERACLINCTVGAGVRIAGVGSYIANYRIMDGACIEDVGLMQTSPGAKFGNGVEVEVLNEGGGREVALFNALSAQFAHMLVMHRYRDGLAKKLSAMAQAAAQAVAGDMGCVGAGAKIAGVGRIVDVNIGAAATVRGAVSLDDGTILSSADAPTLVGDGVLAHHFIIAEAAQVTEGAVVGKSYVGQGCRIGKQYSMEGSLFFANCEGFHGEACSVFAGPYSVTHHKSTLLIAVALSFYNAGSGTNQSNHMYKLGPVHEGRLERGCKTGSFSYMMWPCRVGPFSVVLGKHTRTFDLTDLPFSHVEAASDGRCMVVPGLHLSTVGTVRDGAKWPARDRRRGKVKRDRISFDVFSPFTVGKMIRASALLKTLQDETPKSVDTVTINGAQVKRVLLRTGQKHYRMGIENYLLEKVAGRIECGLAGGKSLAGALAVAKDSVYSERWVDVGGQLMPQQRLDDISAGVESGRLADVAALEAALDKAMACYVEDEWAWVRTAFQQYFGVDLGTLDAAGAARIADDLLAARSKFLNLILVDAGKEFDEVTQTGFGQDGGAGDRAADFRAVRGQFDTNKFVVQMRGAIDEMAARIAKLKQALAAK